MTLRHGRRVALLIVVVLSVVSLTGVAAGVGATAPEPVDSPNSLELQADTPERSVRESSGADGVLGNLNSDGRVTVEVMHHRGVGSAVRDEVRRFDGVVIGSSPGVTLVRIAPSAVAALEKRPGVEHVRLPLRVDLLPDVSPSTELDLGATDVHVAVTNAASWLAAGHDGTGVKVGIIDYFGGAFWSAAESAGALPAPAATFCRDIGTSCDLWSAGEQHGVAVAEIVHDMAPGSSLYLATAVSVTDLAAAVAWFDSQGVQVISRSLAAQLDGPGDGTGSVDAVVDDAVARGMIWLNAAGNHASASGTADGGYWRGPWVDTNANGWLDFASGDEALGFFCGGIQGVRWSDWGSSGTTDYDIEITDASSGSVLATSIEDQTTGAPPLELFDQIDCGAHPVLNLWIQLYDAGSGTAGDVLEFMVNGTAFEYSSNPYSATQPASDSANPGMISVGAIDPPAGTAIALYSSQGPTNDGRIKPDISSPSCLPTVTYSSSCFDGSSAAAPVAAGAAALVWGAGVATSPESAAQYLRDHVIDRGAAGPDMIYGYGQFVLGAPPSPPPNVAPVVSAGSDMTITLPASASLGGTASDDGRPSGVLTTTWAKVSGPGTVTFGNATTLSTTVGFSADGVYVLRLSATDGVLSTSDDVKITVNPAPPPPLPPDFFIDDDDSVFEADINWIAEAGITKGCNPPVNDRFCPDSNVTRGQMAAFLVRALGLSDRLDDPFTDDDDSIFEADIERLAAAGITKGCNPPTNDRFCPDAKVSREQMAAFLVRALKYTDDGGGDLFVDDDDSIFEADIDRLATAGVTKGCNPPSNTKFCPTNSVTRGQMAAFLHRALG